jgi:hypothetical protein
VLGLETSNTTRCEPWKYIIISYILMIPQEYGQASVDGPPILPLNAKQLCGIRSLFIVFELGKESLEDGHFDKCIAHH